MKRLGKTTALLLCSFMLISGGEISSAAAGGEQQSETERIIETLPLEEVTEIEPKIEPEQAIEYLVRETLSILDAIPETPPAGRIKETLALAPLETGAGEYIIYWNPGDGLPRQMETGAPPAATASNSAAQKGSDKAGGSSPDRPLKTLAAVMEQAKRWQQQDHIPASRITVYAMNPLEIPKGQQLILNGGGITIASWPGRSDENDTVFYLNGGRLLLLNTVLEAGRREEGADQPQLVYLHGGALQLGRQALIHGRIVLDFRQTPADMSGDRATGSDAEAAAMAATAANSLASVQAQNEAFNLNDYIISDDADTIELLTDYTQADTWRAPLVELQESIELADDLGYLLDVRGTGSSEMVELVRTLYCDDSSREEFLARFALAETTYHLKLEAEIIPAARIRTAGVRVATEKRLFGVLADNDERPVYWNPGGPITVDGTTYPAGLDQGNSGNDENSSVQTWERAVFLSNGGKNPIVAMQMLDLGSSEAANYITPDAPGVFTLRGTSPDNRLTVMPWSRTRMPAFYVPAGVHVTLENLILQGSRKGIGIEPAQILVCDGGDVLIENLVRGETGIIQVNAGPHLANHPIKVNNYREADEKITVFYSGINQNLAYRFVDVIVPGDTLMAAIAAGTVAADQVGDELLARFKLAPANRDAAHGGASQFDWILRKDTPNEDTDGDNPQNLELYAAHYYDAVYLNGENGNDGNLGATCYHPVRTWERAVRIWQEQMTRSIAARTAAAGQGQSGEYINRMYPMPTRIYLCGTVTVNDDQTGAKAWQLSDRTDYNGQPVKTEVVSHIHIPKQLDGSGDPVHDLPNPLVQVSGSGRLEIRDVTIRNVADQKDSLTLLAENGGSLILGAKTTLTGEQPAEIIDGQNIEAKALTRGIHVKAAGGAAVVMDASWTGSIEAKNQGLTAAGSGTAVTMKGGFIQKNNSFDEEMYNTETTGNNLTGQLKGAGVVLSGGAAFEMDGGTITENTVYQTGAGVYLTGENTRFVMKKGEISRNKMAKNHVNWLNNTGYQNLLNGQGIGVYAGSGTSPQLGTGGAKTDVVIKENTAYRGQGIGVWSAAELKVNGASILSNKTIGTNEDKDVTAVQGVGVYISSQGLLTMKNADVTANTANQQAYAVTQGAGIYIGSTSAESTITDNTVIDGNRGGYDNYKNSGNQGGGIYTAGNLRIEDSRIGNLSTRSGGNQAMLGGGIYAHSTSSYQRIGLILRNTAVSYNNGQGIQRANYGYGGGIYASRVNAEFYEGVTIKGNYAYDNSGGLYLDRCSMKMRGTKTAPILVAGNESRDGGGFYLEDSAIDAVSEEKEHVIISENHAVSRNGGGVRMIRGTFLAKNMNITKNTASNSGGGLCLTQINTKLEQMKISENTADYSGGGLYLDGGTIAARDVRIESNQSTALHSSNQNMQMGGGIYTSSVQAYFERVTLKSNSAAGPNETAGGGGIAFSGSDRYYLSDCTIENNYADESRGGGFFFSGGDARVYLSESSDHQFSFTGNRAKYGGGIYLAAGAGFYWDISKPAENTVTADGQGNNLYFQAGGDSAMLQGSFVQPAGSPAYNVYLDVTVAAGNAVLKIDPRKAKIEKSTSGDPNAVFLNTGNSYLTYLRLPADDAAMAAMPVDVNTNALKVGSVVVRPAALEKIVLYRPNAALTAAEAYDSDQYNRLDDAGAGSGKAYVQGGKLPGRTELGSFADAENSNLTNIVLVSQGVYLASFGTDAAGYGDSPLNPVQTFAYAKTLLEQKIQTEYDLYGRYGNGEGYAPFIYICGTVNVPGGEPDWELDYDDPLFTVTNALYQTAEEARNETAYPAQIRRFASFVDAPMIQLGNGTDQADFAMGKIIINGMSEAVISKAQGSRSPMVKIMPKARLTLTACSQLTNNYYSGIDLYGELELNSQNPGQTPEDQQNYQLYNHQGTYVRVMESGASLLMKDRARIIARGQERLISGSNRDGVHAVAGCTNVTVEMNDASAIVNAEENNEPATLLEKGIYLGGADSLVSVRDNARIENVINGIDLDGERAATVLNTAGNYPTITASGRGIWIGAQDAHLLMQGRSKIESTDTVSTSNYGVYGNSEKGIVHLLDFAEIKGFYYGIYSQGQNSRIYLNDCDPPDTYYLDPEAGAKIWVRNYGIYLTGDSSGTKVSMGAKARLSDHTSGRRGTGIWLASLLNTVPGTQIVMDGESVISGMNHAIRLDQCSSPISITMSGRAAIEGGNQGIYEYALSNRGCRTLDLTMNGNSRISGNSNYGISLNGRMAFTHSDLYYHKITMNDQAIIGGSTYYSYSDPASGNENSGIYANSPLQLQMNGRAKISGNGNVGISASTSCGVYIPSRYTSSSYTRKGTAVLELNDHAEISGNRGGGVYIYDVIGDLYANPTELILNGSGGGRPAIKENTDKLYLGSKAKLKLIDHTLIGRPTIYTDTTLDCYGEIAELDGRSVIEGRIWLREKDFPITLTYSPFIANKYSLWLAESFLGQVVIRPGGAVSDASVYLDYFEKEGGDGMAAAKHLLGKNENIILEGENNVYLSGSGYDTNSGLSPSTPVRTFDRARTLLRTGNFTAGANIYLVGSRVDVLAGDEDWSFDPGGYVTNAVTGYTWKPLVKRHAAYDRQLIGVIGGLNTAYAPTVTFKDITIDGGSEERRINGSSSSSHMLHIEYSGSTAVLGAGAVFQNNHVYSGLDSRIHFGAGVYLYGGTLILDGGTIRGMIREIGDAGSAYDTRGASAIYCASASAFHPGQVIIRKGRVEDNEFRFNRVLDHRTLQAAAIYLADQDSALLLEGGTITGNQVTVSPQADSLTVCGGAVYNNQGTVTINGGSIRNNRGGYGSAIYYAGGRVDHGPGTIPDNLGSVILTGGQIKDNVPNQAGRRPEKQYSPIYVEGWDFRLNGGGTELGDNIYLAAKTYLITVSQNIYQYGRNYHIYLNQTDGDYFGKGSVVVQPDGNWVADVTGLMAYFRLHSDIYVLDHGQAERNAGTIGTVKEHSCLILMKAVYLDGENGNDLNDGVTPATAAATFTRAKQIGAKGLGDPDYYIIYISGKTTNTAAESIWTLPKTAYLCRYTGFSVYRYDPADGREIMTAWPAYQEYLIEPSTDLTLDGIRIQGRQTMDPEEKNGNSIVHVTDGRTVVMRQSDDSHPTRLEMNNNNGNYLIPGSVESLPSKGGAFRVDAGGRLEILGGSIRETQGTFGGAVYLGADDGPAASDPLGKMSITNSPSVAGGIYLAGIGTAFSAYLEADQNYRPPRPLAVSVENDYSGRPVVKYTDNYVPGLNEKKDYRLDDSLVALYEFVNGMPPQSSPSTLELLIRRAIYLDGEGGSDANDGATPETAFATLEKVYTTIRDEGGSQGVLVFVVRPVSLTAGDGQITLSNLQIEDSANDRSYYIGYYQKNEEPRIEVFGQVYFKRYARPYYKDMGNTDPDGYNQTGNERELFIVENGGHLILKGLTLDGHSLDSVGTTDKLVAKAVKAAGPLITVGQNGALSASMEPPREIPGAKATPTVLINNLNANNKTNIIGTLRGADIREGTGAGIEIFETGTVTLDQTQFRNLKLGSEVVAGGTDIYHYGGLRDANDEDLDRSGLKLSNFTLFEGTVFLEGFGYEQGDAVYGTDSSRYLEVNVSGRPLETNFRLLIRDVYNHRKTVHYTGASAPPDTDIGYYRLEERVKDFFYLARRPGNDRILELQVPAAVYIDGTYGTDEREGPAAIRAGSAPATPVKSLLRAYELLSSRGGGTIYVVNAVQLESDALISGTRYKGEGEVNLGNTDKVRIVRYIQPDFAYGRDGEQEIIDKGYAVKSYHGPLLNVNSGAEVTILDEVYLDGHSEPKVTSEAMLVYYSPETTVTGTKAILTAKAPLITVAEGGTLALLGGASLSDNNNTYNPDTDPSGIHGGAIHNRGTVTVAPDAAKEMFTNLQAAWGSVVYQDGTFTVQSSPQQLHLPNAFYLAASGGENRVIRTAVPWPVETVTGPGGSTAAVPLVYDVEMDNAVAGRDVIRFLDSAAYDPDADAEHEHFKLGFTVPERLFLVEAAADPSVLELQDWKTFKVAVPADIYLIVYRRGTMESSKTLKGIRTDTPETELLSSPQYKILNEGRYDVKVLVDGFANKTAEAGISQDIMSLKESPAQALGNRDIYLAIKGSDTLTATPVPYGFALAETALEPYGHDPVTAPAAELGVIEGKIKDSSNPSPAYIGTFDFVGQVGEGFVEKYKNPSFPLNDPAKTKSDVQKYIDGTDSTGVINAKAKYQLKYRLEMVPKRAGGTAASQGLKEQVPD